MKLFAMSAVVACMLVSAVLAGEGPTTKRTLRIADGPDEVHRILIARNVLSSYAAGESWDFGN